MRILITGCTSFLGRSFTQIGSQQGHGILGISRSTRPAGSPGEHLQRNSLADLDPVIQDFAPDAILHVAGPASVSSSFSAPVDDMESSVLTWTHILDSVRRSGLAPVVVFPSSAAVYGNPGS